MKPTRLHLLLLVTFTFASCARHVESFSLSLPHGDVSLTEDHPIPSEEEGRFLPGDGFTPLYSLRNARQVPGTGEIWSFRIEDLDRTVSIEVYDDESIILAARSIAPPAGFAGTIDAGLFIPAGGIAASFRLMGTGSEPGPRLRGVEVRSPVVTGGGASESANGLKIDPGVDVAAWSLGDDHGMRWQAGLTRRDGPVDVEYRYDPPDVSDGTGSSGDAGSATLVPVPPAVSLKVGERLLRLAARPGRNHVVVYPAGNGTTDAAGGTLPVTVISDVSGFRITGVSGGTAAHAIPDLLPIPADLGTILDYPTSSWREPDHELFAWTLYPSVLIMDTRSYEVQARYFKRLAFFVEKEGFRGTLLSNSRLEGRHGYNAHNYDAASLAEFFNAASQTGFELNPEEGKLRDILIHSGVIAVRGDDLVPGSGGILSISRESAATPGLRTLLLTHESFHGVYYADEAYQEAVDGLWAGLTDDERHFWILLLDGLQYDVTDPYLVRNEFHAYLLQQDIRQVPWYFETRSADRLRAWKPNERAWIDSFLAHNSGTFLDQARRANEILFRNSGLVGGDVLCLTPVSQP